jgi:hypothetical protein
VVQFEEWTSENLKHRYLRLIKRIRDEKLADRCTIPFVPYRGSAYGDDNKPKILVIGKATYGLGKGKRDRAVVPSRMCKTGTISGSISPRDESHSANTTRAGETDLEVQPSEPMC